MKESLDIKAINVRHHIRNGFPENQTLSIFDNKTVIRILNILHESDEKGFVKVEKNGTLKEFFQVEQILYKGFSRRFSNYDSKGNQKGLDSNNYIMGFEEFERKGRPKRIYIDFYNSVSLEE